MVRIITDTTAVLSQNITEEYQIVVVPQLIHFGTDTFIEGKDIDHESFLQRLKSSSTLPKTAAPPPDFFTEHFRGILEKDDHILCIHPSTALSGTVRSATVASQDFPRANIRVLDTRLIASPLGTVVHQAAVWAEQGMSLDTIYEKAHSLSKQADIYFLVATLDYLARGGRIGGASAFIGNALKLKPILTLENGSVEPFGKERTIKRALQRITDIVCSAYPAHNEGHLSIMHADVPDQAQALSETFQHRLGISPPRISPLPPAIVTHAGPGALAVGFFNTG